MPNWSGCDSVWLPAIALLAHLSAVPAAQAVPLCTQSDRFRPGAAGADKVVDPYEISGAQAHELIQHPEVVELLEQSVFGLQDPNIAEITIPHDVWSHGVHLSALKKVMTQNIILLGVVDLERGKDMVFSTRGIDHKLDYNDVPGDIGARKELDAFREWIDRKIPPPSD